MKDPNPIMSTFCFSVTDEGPGEHADNVLMLDIVRMVKNAR